MTSFTVGRGEQADVQLSHDTVSRLHLRITPISANECLVEDLGSANGTWLLRGEQRIAITSDRLTPPDLLALGEYPISVAQILSLYQQGPTPERGRTKTDADSNTRDPFSRYVRSEDGRYVRKPK